jgi:hypothetical protein
MDLILSITFAVVVQLIAQVAGILSLVILLLGVLDNLIYKYHNERQIFAKAPILEKWVYIVGNVSFHAYLITTFVYIFL